MDDPGPFFKGSLRHVCVHVCVRRNQCYVALLRGDNNKKGRWRWRLAFGVLMLMLMLTMALMTMRGLSVFLVGGGE